MRVLLFFLVIALLWGGGQAIYTTATNLKPGTYTIEEYYDQKPNDKWLELKDCELDLLEASYESFLGVGTPSQVYIPVRPAEAAETDETRILLATKDTAICALVGRMSDIDSEQAMLAFVMQNREALLPTRDVKGLVRFGIDMDDGDRRKLQELGENLSKDFVVIDEGKSPEWFMVLMFPAGLVLAWVLFFAGRKQPPQLPPGQGTPPPMPPQPPTAPPALR